MLEAVILDWGGVVAEDPSGPLMRFCAAKLHVGVQEFRKAFDRCGTLFQSGRVDERRFWELICTLLARDVSGYGQSIWGQAFRAVYRPRPQVLLLVERLRQAGIRTCLLSNTEPPCVDFFCCLGYRCFDFAVFSCQVGLVKPDRRIYRLALQRLDVAPANCLFVDDRQAFVRAARSVGIQAEVYQGPHTIEWSLASRAVRL